MQAVQVYHHILVHLILLHLQVLQVQIQFLVQLHQQVAVKAEVNQVHQAQV